MSKASSQTDSPPSGPLLTGLSQAQAAEILARDGANELPRASRRTPLLIALEVLREPMLAMLLAAGIIYLVLGDRTEAVVLLLFALLSSINCIGSGRGLYARFADCDRYSRGNGMFPAKPQAIAAAPTLSGMSASRSALEMRSRSPNVS